MTFSLFKTTHFWRVHQWCTCLYIFQMFAEIWCSVFVKFSSFESFKVCQIFVKRTYFKSLLKISYFKSLLRVFYFKNLLKVFYRSPEGLLSICVCWIFLSVHLSKVCWSSTIVLEQFTEGLLSESKTSWVKVYFGFRLHIVEHDSLLVHHRYGIKPSKSTEMWRLAHHFITTCTLQPNIFKTKTIHCWNAIHCAPAISTKILALVFIIDTSWQDFQVTVSFYGKFQYLSTCGIPNK